MKIADTHIPRLFLIVPFVALTTHIATCIFLADRPPSPDELEYLELGRSIAESGQMISQTGDQARRMPLYPLILSAELRGMDRQSMPTGILIIQAFAAWGITLMLAYLAYVLADIHAGILAGLTSALYQPFLYLQNAYLTETVTTFLLMSAILVYFLITQSVKSKLEERVGFMIMSLCLALAFLTRASAIIFVFPFLFDLFKRRKEGSFLIRAGILSSLVLTAVLGWSARNYFVIGRFTSSTGGGLNFYLGHNPDYSRNPSLSGADYSRFTRIRQEQGLSESDADRSLYRKGMQFVFENPARSFADIGLKAAVWVRSTFPYCGPILPIAALSILIVQLSKSCATGVNDKRRIRLFARFAWALLIVTIGYHIWRLTHQPIYVPFMSPRDVVLLGLLSIPFVKIRGDAKRIIIGLLLAQFIVAIVFIPIARLRWQVDGLLIVALSVAVSNLGNRLSRAAT